MNIHPSKKSELIFVTRKYENEIWEAKDFILKLGLGEKIVVQKDKAGIPENAISILKDGIELYMPLEDLVDMEEERKRLEEEKTRLESEVARCVKNAFKSRICKQSTRKENTGRKRQTREIQRYAC